MRLYLLHQCPFGHRASMALQEKRLAFDRGFFTVGKRPPELEALGPYAKSPTLFDGEARVWDSQIVLEYLEDRYPERPLMPANAVERAEVRMLAARVQRGVEAQLQAAVTAIFGRPPKDERKISEASRAFVALLDEWDQRLEDRRFLIGDDLTLADITLFTVFPAMRHMAGVEIPAERRHLRAWFDGLSARPSAALLAPLSADAAISAPG
jgi:glutathione S-transferase